MADEHGRAVPGRGRASGRMYPDSDRYKHFKASKNEANYYGLTDDERFIEVRYDDHQPSDAQEEWTVDEVVTAGLHLEMQDIDVCWMNIKGLHVWFRAERVKGSRQLRLVVTCSPESCTPVVVTAEQASGDRVPATTEAERGGVS